MPITSYNLATGYNRVESNWEVDAFVLHIIIIIRDSFRKISKGGKSTSEDILGGGGARVQWAVFNFEGLQFPREGIKFSRGGGGGECPPPP